MVANSLQPPTLNLLETQTQHVVDIKNIEAALHGIQQIERRLKGALPALQHARDQGAPSLPDDDDVDRGFGQGSATAPPSAVGSGSARCCRRARLNGQRHGAHHLLDDDDAALRPK